MILYVLRYCGGRGAARQGARGGACEREGGGQGWREGHREAGLGGTRHCAARAATHLHKVGKLGVARRHQPVHLALNLALVRVLGSNVPLAEARLALAVLQQEEAHRHGSGARTHEQERWDGGAAPQERQKGRGNERLSRHNRASSSRKKNQGSALRRAGRFRIRDATRAKLAIH